MWQFSCFFPPQNPKRNNNELLSSGLLSVLSFQPLCSLIIIRFKTHELLLLNAHLFKGFLVSVTTSNSV